MTRGRRANVVPFLGEARVIERVPKFTIAPIAGEEADHLLLRSDEYMAALYPAESNHLVSSESLRSGDALFLGAFTQAPHEEGVASIAASHRPSVKRCIGCVAARFYREQGYAEIKRLFVDEAFRGNAIAKRLMSAVERGVVAQGVHCARLEMGIYQPEAETLYRALGYRTIPPFGDYLLDPLSQFLEKALGDTDERLDPGD